MGLLPAEPRKELLNDKLKFDSNKYQRMSKHSISLRLFLSLLALILQAIEIFLLNFSAEYRNSLNTGKSLKKVHVKIHT